MSKQWKPNQFRYLDKQWLSDFRQIQENQLNNDHQWSPQNSNVEPIGGEYAWPLIGDENEQKG